MSHRNARLTPTGRRIVIERIAAGTPQAHVAAQILVSRATVSKWRRRWLTEAGAGPENTQLLWTASEKAIGETFVLG